MDVSGSHSLDIHDHSVFRQRLDAYGRSIGGKSTRISLEALKQDVNSPTARRLRQFLEDSNKPGYCGSCYGAASDDVCCNTCDSVLDKYKQMGWDFRLDMFDQCAAQAINEKLELANGEGCRLYGNLKINRVLCMNLYLGCRQFSLCSWKIC